MSPDHEMHKLKLGNDSLGQDLKRVLNETEQSYPLLNNNKENDVHIDSVGDKNQSSDAPLLESFRDDIHQISQRTYRLPRPHNQAEGSIEDSKNNGINEEAFLPPETKIGDTNSSAYHSIVKENANLLLKKVKNQKDIIHSLEAQLGQKKVDNVALCAQIRDLNMRIKESQREHERYTKQMISDYSKKVANLEKEYEQKCLEFSKLRRELRSQHISLELAENQLGQQEFEIKLLSSDLKRLTAIVQDLRLILRYTHRQNEAQLSKIRVKFSSLRDSVVGHHDDKGKSKNEDQQFLDENTSFVDDTTSLLEDGTTVHLLKRFVLEDAVTQAPSQVYMPHSKGKFLFKALAYSVLFLVRVRRCVSTQLHERSEILSK